VASLQFCRSVSSNISPTVRPTCRESSRKSGVCGLTQSLLVEVSQAIYSQCKDSLVRPDQDKLPYCKTEFKSTHKTSLVEVNHKFHLWKTKIFQNLKLELICGTISWELDCFATLLTAAVHPLHCQSSSVLQVWKHPKQFLNHTPTPKLPIRAPKSQKDPKIKSNSNVRIQGNIENKSCSTTWVHPKTVFEPFPKIPPLGPQKVKNDHKIKSKSNVRMERNKEMKVAQLHE